MARPTASLARLERENLADALVSAGPDAPTLCAGWSAVDLAAHVVVRERRPDSLPGLAVPVLRGHTERVRRAAAALGLPPLVDRLRKGPPPWSPFALPGVDARANLFEFLVHHEDVRRGSGAGPRTPAQMPPDLPEEVWRGLRGVGRLFARRVGGGLHLRRDDGRQAVLRAGDDPATLVGEPVELALYLFGRRAAAVVAVEGSEAARRRLAEADLSA